MTPTPENHPLPDQAVRQSLLLYFPDVNQRSTCQLMLHHLLAGNIDRALHWANQLGPSVVNDFGPGWRRWRQPSLETSGPWLVLRYETLSMDELPLAPLRALSAAGLRAARLQVHAPDTKLPLELHLLDGRKVPWSDWVATVPILPGSSRSGTARTPGSPEGWTHTHIDNRLTATTPISRPTPAATMGAQTGAAAGERPTASQTHAPAAGRASTAEAAAMAYVRSNQPPSSSSRSGAWTKLSDAFR